jgi:hypothetical protein
MTTQVAKPPVPTQSVAFLTLRVVEGNCTHGRSEGAFTGSTEQSSNEENVVWASWACESYSSNNHWDTNNNACRADDITSNSR